jgi:hypothetical protein
MTFLMHHNLKQSKSVYILTQWKENLARMTTMEREIDRANPVNALKLFNVTVSIKGDSFYQENHLRRSMARACGTSACNIRQCGGLFHR